MLATEQRYEVGVDSFEQVVSEILWMERRWVRTSVKVDLTKDPPPLFAALGAGYRRLQRSR
jgi:hypothetical protein